MKQKSLFAALFLFLFGSSIANAQNTFPVSGNVGIGTTSPQFSLDVTGSSRIGGTFYSNTGLQVYGNPSAWPAGKGIQLAYVDGSTGYGYLTSFNNTTYSFTPLVLRGSDIIFQSFSYYGSIFSSGNWVLSSNPVDGGFKLDVNGSTRLSGTVNLTGLSGDNTQGKIIVSDANGKLFFRDVATISGSGSNGWSLSGNTAVNPATTFLGTTDNSPITFRTGNAEQMRIDGTTGNVGIGTTQPQSKLAVKGTVTAQKIVVTQSGWADYVFEPAYKLMPLKDLEKFVGEHGHLPEVPTTEEIASYGKDLGEDQALLCKELDEMTLYLIQQNKELEELKQENRQLRRMIVPSHISRRSSHLRRPLAAKR